MGNLWIVIWLLVFWYLFIRRKKRTAAIIQHIRNKGKKDKEKSAMKELAKQFIGKECIIYTFDRSDGLQGIIKEVCDGGIIVESVAGERQAINLDFITRIREYSRKKNGKKKTF